MRFQAVLTEETGGYVAQCLELDVASQGGTAEEALDNLKEALELYFEDEPARTITPAQICTLEISVP